MKFEFISAVVCSTVVEIDVAVVVSLVGIVALVDSVFGIVAAVCSFEGTMVADNIIDTNYIKVAKIV